MSQVCELTGKRPAYGNKVSHSNIKTRTRWMPNLRKKSYEIPELKQTIALLLSTRAIRTIDKLGGITPAIMSATEKLLSVRLAKIRNQIYTNRVKRTALGKTPEGKVAAAATRATATKNRAASAAAVEAPAKVAKAAKAPKAAKEAKAAKPAKAKKPAKS